MEYKISISLNKIIKISSANKGPKGQHTENFTIPLSRFVLSGGASKATFILALGESESLIIIP